VTIKFNPNMLLNTKVESNREKNAQKRVKRKVSLFGFMTNKLLAGKSDVATSRLHIHTSIWIVVYSAVCLGETSLHKALGPLLLGECGPPYMVASTSLFFLPSI
jgi:hypothetical protein